MSESKVFDYIVVGAGSSGCVVANRLSADPGNRVCLVEAGPDVKTPLLRLLSTMPAGMVNLLASRRTNWHYELADEVNGIGRAIPCPRGRIVGGTSVVNGMVYSRGDAQDYDHWRQLGNVGWSYDDVLPFFRRHEDFADGEDPWHGVGGELPIERLAHPHELTRAFLRSAVEAGFELNADFNGARQAGFGLHHLNQRRGERMSAARSFLDPIRSRRNLALRTETTVLRVVIDDGAATGIEVRHRGRTSVIHCRGEIILCGGAINSPQLLMLSGIGDPEALRALGITPIADLPGVGRNFQDHPGIVVANADKSRSSLALTPRGLPRLAAQPLLYAFGRRGALAGSVINGGGYVSTRPGSTRPDVKIDFMPLARPFGKVMPRIHGFNVFAWVLRPESRGRLRLASADPGQHPIIEPAFLRSEADMAAITSGIRVIRRILSQPAMQAYMGGELVPGPRIDDEEQLRRHALANHGTIYHPSGTCRMGPASDAMAVVDERLRVRGIAALRVADTSIMPAIVSGNTNAPAMMIGERAAAFVLQDARAAAPDQPVSNASSATSS